MSEGFLSQKKEALPQNEMIFCSVSYVFGVFFNL
jgi:hypothetical protein